MDYECGNTHRNSLALEPIAPNDFFVSLMWQLINKWPIKLTFLTLDFNFDLLNDAWTNLSHWEKRLFVQRLGPVYGNDICMLFKVVTWNMLAHIFSVGKKLKLLAFAS